MAPGRRAQAGGGRRAPPPRPWDTATISATTDRAISPGALPPMSSPAGTCRRASASAASSRARVANTCSARRGCPSSRRTRPGRRAPAAAGRRLRGVVVAQHERVGLGRAGGRRATPAGSGRCPRRAAASVRRPAISAIATTRPADRVVGDDHDPAAARGSSDQGCSRSPLMAAERYCRWQTRRVILDGGLSNALARPRARPVRRAVDGGAAPRRTRGGRRGAPGLLRGRGRGRHLRQLPGQRPGFERAGCPAVRRRRCCAGASPSPARCATSSPPTARRLLVAASVGPYGAVLADGSEYRGRYGLACPAPRLPPAPPGGARRRGARPVRGGDDAPTSTRPPCSSAARRDRSAGLAVLLRRGGHPRGRSRWPRRSQWSPTGTPCPRSG